jgi:ribonuclease HI
MTHLLPANWHTVPPKEHEIPQGCSVVICDASFKEGVAGISVSIRTNGKEYQPFEYSAKSRGPVHAELKAVEKALKRLCKLSPSRSVTSLIIYTDCKYACNFLEQRWTPRRGYIQDVMAGVNKCLHELNTGDLSLVICHTRTKHIRRCDRRARRRREEELDRKRDRVISRIMRVDATIARGREISINESDGYYYAVPKTNGFPPGYRVSLHPVSCSCPWWMHNWADKEEAAVNARALPCKHMCALAEHLGTNVYDVFSHQIERLD